MKNLFLILATILSLGFITNVNAAPTQPEGDKEELFDIVLDIGFVLWSAADVVMTGGSTTAVTALTADIACVFIPGATGGGAAVRAASIGSKTVVHSANTTLKTTSKTYNILEYSWYFKYVFKAGQKVSVKVTREIYEKAAAKVLSKHGSKSTAKFAKGVSKGKVKPKFLNMHSATDVDKMVNKVLTKVNTGGGKVATTTFSGVPCVQMLVKMDKPIGVDHLGNKIYTVIMRVPQNINKGADKSGHVFDMYPATQTAIANFNKYFGF